ncbi:MAG: hypothetical protein QOH30_2376, partial [Baekduia sp.]|nr:hypothetical protein [Baekduia sp.]
EGATDGFVVERGRITDVAYVGMVTKFTVDLAQGGELQVVRQNLETSHGEAVAELGREVQVGWRADHTSPLATATDEEAVQ